jgi:hypothetical protein
VVAGVEGVARDRVDQADVRRSRPVAFAQDDPSQVVLADQGQASAEPLS